MKVMGVKPAAPMRPIRSAKNGRQMATKVVSTTYRLRTIARMSQGLLEGHSCLSVMKVSTFSKTGCAKICRIVTANQEQASTSWQYKEYHCVVKRVWITLTASECRGSLVVPNSIDFPFHVGTLLTLTQQQRPSS